MVKIKIVSAHEEEDRLAPSNPFLEDEENRESPQELVMQFVQVAKTFSLLTKNWNFKFHSYPIISA